MHLPIPCIYHTILLVVAMEMDVLERSFLQIRLHMLFSSGNKLHTYSKYTITVNLYNNLVISNKQACFAPVLLLSLIFYFYFDFYNAWRAVFIFDLRN